jgi:hypothetical protein
MPDRGLGRVGHPGTSILTRVQEGRSPTPVIKRLLWGSYGLLRSMTVLSRRNRHSSPRRRSLRTITSFSTSKPSPTAIWQIHRLAAMVARCSPRPCELLPTTQTTRPSGANRACWRISGLKPLRERLGDLLRLVQWGQMPGVSYHDQVRLRDISGDLGRQLGWGQLVAVADQHQRRAAGSTSSSSAVV